MAKKWKVLRVREETHKKAKVKSALLNKDLNEFIDEVVDSYDVGIELNLEKRGKNEFKFPRF